MRVNGLERIHNRLDRRFKERSSPFAEERPDSSDSSQSALAGMSGIEGRSLSKAALVKSPLRR